MSFQISALPREAFEPLFGMSDEKLRSHRAMRQRVTRTPGTPCRISLQDAAVGEEVILLHYTHHPAESPFHAGHAIYVRVDAAQAMPRPGEIPPMLRSRLLSVRGFDAAGMMRNAGVTPGEALASTIEGLLAEESVAYLHLHNAREGCYLARADRT